MDWMKQAEQELKSYERRRQSLQNTAERIRALREQMLALDGGDGGLPQRDSCIAEIERLGHARDAAARLVGLVERGLASLPAPERRALELFYLRRQPGHVQRLMEELHLEQVQVYRIKSAALRHFTLSLYGVTGR